MLPSKPAATATGLGPDAVRVGAAPDEHMQLESILVLRPTFCSSVSPGLARQEDRKTPVIEAGAVCLACMTAAVLAVAFCFVLLTLPGSRPSSG